ncbi:type II toxin-antitoxin system VapC family toxin [Massilia glaciei]|uniref:Ribonuclease VapC n=1 Tax=Massilia glaciei TaxID=1524097 RepID=A0A2U2HGV5_9BURK|nr:type II toxin-antitoxin system VapC family toxin [Massilia glaciei]PWF44669.1 type II toxin-antitoxin system VapC family toxin [Massilia glaciei]
MIILDTNVVSEALKFDPNPAVRAWLNHQSAETLYLSSVALAELLFGVGALPTGRRQDLLAKALDGLLGLFKDRILPFDTEAAQHYAKLAVTARGAGRFLTPDGYIAAIAASRRFIVASRDAAPYEAAGVAAIDPWGG